MKYLKSNFSINDFSKFMSELEQKEEFNCVIHSKGGCACDGSMAYCPGLVTK